MAFSLSSMLKVFFPKKKRHNPSDPLFTELDQPKKLNRPITRDEFLRVYETMPETARVNLFTSLNAAQKERLLHLLAHQNEVKDKSHREEEKQWLAEDFLPVKDEKRVEKLRQVKELKDLKELYSSFEKYTPKVVADILSGEAAHVAAVVLLQFEKRFASQVVRFLPELSRGEIVRQMASERHIASDALLALGKKIATLLTEHPQQVGETIDGIKHVNDILKLMGVDEAERITREISHVDDTLASHLEKSRYVFDDLVELNSRDFRTVFSAIPDTELWARALKAFDQSKRKSLLGKLPIKRAAAIVEAMAQVKTTRLDSIDKARGKILREALRLAAVHEIQLGR